MSLSCKVTFENNHRRFFLNREESHVNFVDYLLTKIKDLFGLSSLVMQYKDEDGDMISIYTDAEAQHAVDYCRTRGIKCLHLIVTKATKKSSTAAALSPAITTTATAHDTTDTTTAAATTPKPIPTPSSNPTNTTTTTTTTSMQEKAKVLEGLLRNQQKSRHSVSLVCAQQPKPLKLASPSIQQLENSLFRQRQTYLRQEACRKNQRQSLLREIQGFSTTATAAPTGCLTTVVNGQLVYRQSPQRRVQAILACRRAIAYRLEEQGTYQKPYVYRCDAKPSSQWIGDRLVSWRFVNGRKMIVQSHAARKSAEAACQAAVKYFLKEKNNRNFGDNNNNNLNNNTVNKISSIKSVNMCMSPASLQAAQQACQRALQSKKIAASASGATSASGRHGLSTEKDVLAAQKACQQAIATKLLRRVNQHKHYQQQRSSVQCVSLAPAQKIAARQACETAIHSKNDRAAHSLVVLRNKAAEARRVAEKVALAAAKAEANAIALEQERDAMVQAQARQRAEEGWQESLLALVKMGFDRKRCVELMHEKNGDMYVVLDQLLMV